MITGRQESFIHSLMVERDMEGQFQEFMDSNPTKQEASRKIKELLAIRPTKLEGPDLSGIPSGFYAIQTDEETKFLKIDNVDNPESIWHGYIFVKIQASDDFWRLGYQRPNSVYKGKRPELVEMVLQDSEHASRLYGQLIGKCGVCGRTLTDPESIAAGIGPICAGRFG